MADNVSEVVKNFFVSFSEALRSQNTLQISQFYENGGLRMPEKVKQSEWPSPSTVASFVSDKVFNLLYKEMYYRHLLANPKSHQGLTLEQRQTSFANYLELFDHLLNRTDSPGLDLPAAWIWDIIDEFVYQFQEFYHYRGNRLRSSKGEDVSSLKSSSAVWNVQVVLKYLQAFRDKSDIIATLSNPEIEALQSKNSAASTLPFSFSTHPLYKLFGYFSLIGLLRVHCLLGDYYMALKSIAALQSSSKKNALFVPASKISLFYYIGFSYMMMRRYADAIRTFSHILQWISRLKQIHSKSYQIDDTNKKNEQMYALLAILISFCPQRIDDHVNTTLRENYAEKMVQMQRGEISTVEELFTYGGPKWVSPISEGEELGTANPEMLRLQVKIFSTEIRQQSLLPIIRSYLKLYTTIDIAKLASLIIIDKTKLDEATLTKTLLCYNHKTRGMVSSSGQAALEGKMTSFSDVAFYIDEDMIHIFDTKAPRRFGEFFTRKIVKLEDSIAELSREQS